jgi:hypothetical protein
MDDNTQKTVAMAGIVVVTVAAFYFAGPGAAIGTIFAGAIGILAPALLAKKK